MYKKKSLLITFEGVEGSGKSYHSRKLFEKIKKRKIPSILTREPGGLKNVEQIRKILLNGKKNKFDKTTDALLYLAARNEHIIKILKPAIKKKKVIICDRFIDSTFAYQIHGNKVNKDLVNNVHKKILSNIKPDLTFILFVKISKALSRINKRKTKNRYDKFSKKFYIKVQNAFIKIAKQNKKRCVIINTNKDIKQTETVIFNKFVNKLKK
tara:strand:- start:791 stop:1423 length:633 start_codon:yes stop_codon:yes gene_type:complete